MNVPSQTTPEPSLIVYPCRFPIKVMGANADGFVTAMAQVALACDPGFDLSTLEQRPSKTGRYLGLTLWVWVLNRAQLDDLYRSLSSHPMVKIVL
ncbi:DUF493 family protein [Hydrogenophaga sp.]|uniref:YbeD family protein n=1 Tax=Hydrogenophaga sp. TaxID=1904254 RepID=UPI0019B102A5|nr:DUF493 family protein [Hydrogenophaga sp.]MBD3893015.1 DUF493 family protein [Hydrogenophaga sp.]